jgi:hypothetical protein
LFGCKRVVFQRLAIMTAWLEAVNATHIKTETFFMLFNDVNIASHPMVKTKLSFAVTVLGLTTENSREKTAGRWRSLLHENIKPFLC